MKIKFSIITVCLNAEKTIRDTIESVLNQTYKDYEIIVKDGLSIDNTLNLIPKLENVKVYSIKDSGIYNAMNQAIGFAQGDFLLFLNSGDILYNENVLFNVAEYIEKHEADIYYGDYCRKNVIVKQPSNLTNFALFRNPLNHQSMFFSRKTCELTDWYNEQYSILADYELTVKSKISGKIFLHMPITIDIYEGNGISESKSGREKNKKEMEIIRKKYYSKDYNKYSFIIACSFAKLRGLLVSDKAPKWVTAAYRKISNLFNS